MLMHYWLSPSRSRFGSGGPGLVVACESTLLMIRCFWSSLVCRRCWLGGATFLLPFGVKATCVTPGLRRIDALFDSVRRCWKDLSFLVMKTELLF